MAKRTTAVQNTLPVGTVILMKKRGQVGEFRTKSALPFVAETQTSGYTFGKATFSNGAVLHIGVKNGPARSEFKCQECGKEIRCMNYDEPECPRCGSTDIDINV